MKKTLPSLSDDPFLSPYRAKLRSRRERMDALAERLSQGAGSLAAFANAHEYYGLHRTAEGWVFREFAPNATALWLVGDFSSWERRDAFRATRLEGSRGVWEVLLPADALCHGQHYRLDLEWEGGAGERLPVYARRIVQDSATLRFTAQVWDPKPYEWKHETPSAPAFPLFYEAHVGMAQEREGVGTYREFTEKILPRICEGGYNTVQLMALMEHPYYASFGYQVSSFFACSSRFGTPEELKELIDTAHGMGLRVIMDLVHSHAVDNEYEGPSQFDGTEYLYFHAGTRGRHRVWNSRCFDYGKLETFHLLLSNCRYWLDEFHLDGFRFDGVTSMLYHHHGLGVDFVGYDQYFDDQVDEDALTYLALANRLIHEVRPDAETIAEDVSGMPGLAASASEEGGIGFDARLAMGITECWTKLLRKTADEDWSMGHLWYTLCDHRRDEHSVSYAECHDQAMVGGKTLFFEMADAAIYDRMDVASESLVIDRAVALHKLIRLATLATADGGYLNFMGNEFGHPEWIDFPREGNDNSYAHARRQWSLRDDATLRFHGLGEFDAAMLATLRETQAFSAAPQFLCADEARKILGFFRGSTLFLFNFHASESYSDLPIRVPPAVAYDLVLNSDDSRFGGFHRIASEQSFVPVLEPVGNELVPTLRVYLPSRTAVVLRRRK